MSRNGGEHEAEDGGAVTAAARALRDDDLTASLARFIEDQAERDGRFMAALGRLEATASRTETIALASHARLGRIETWRDIEIADMRRVEREIAELKKGTGTTRAQLASLSDEVGDTQQRIAAMSLEEAQEALLAAREKERAAAALQAEIVKAALEEKKDDRTNRHATRTQVIALIGAAVLALLTYLVGGGHKHFTRPLPQTQERTP